MDVEDLHVLVIERCHPEGECPLTEAADSLCWDPEWTVLHPPTCYSPIELADEDSPHGPTHRCAVDYEFAEVGDDAFDVVQAAGWTDDGPQSIAAVLPAGRYLCRWYGMQGVGADWESGIELVAGPVWDGDREGWDKA